MMRWLVVGLLLSACHQPGPVRPALVSPGEVETDAAPAASDKDQPAGTTAAVDKNPVTMPIVAPAFPADAVVVTNDNVQRTLVIQKTGLELWSNEPPKKITTLLKTEARDISFSPAGDVVAAAVCKSAGTMDCTFTFFRTTDGGVVRTMLVPILDNAQFSKTGSYFLYSNQHGLYVVNMATGTVAAHRENGDATSVSAFGGLENGLEGNASAGWPGVVRVLDDRLVRSSQGLVELTDLITGKVVARHLYKGAGPFAHLLLDEQDTVLTFDAASKALFVWRYPMLGLEASRRPRIPKKISLRGVLTKICNDCQLAKSAGNKSALSASVLLESSDDDFAITIDLTTGKATRSAVTPLTK